MPTPSTPHTIPDPRSFPHPQDLSGATVYSSSPVNTFDSVTGAIMTDNTCDITKPPLLSSDAPAANSLLSVPSSSSPPSPHVNYCLAFTTDLYVTPLKELQPLRRENLEAIATYPDCCSVGSSMFDTRFGSSAAAAHDIRKAFHDRLVKQADIRFIAWKEGLQIMDVCKLVLDLNQIGYECPKQSIENMIIEYLPNMEDVFKKDFCNQPMGPIRLLHETCFLYDILLFEAHFAPYLDLETKNVKELALLIWLACIYGLTEDEVQNVIDSLRNKRSFIARTTQSDNSGTDLHFGKYEQHTQYRREIAQQEGVNRCA